MDSKLWRICYSSPYRKLLFTGLFLTGSFLLFYSVKALHHWNYGDYVRLGVERQFVFWCIVGSWFIDSESFGQFRLSYLANDLGQRARCKEGIVKHIVYLKLKYFDQHPIGMLVTRAVSDIETIAEIFSQGIFWLL